jgi:hypothetical protein
MRRLVSSFLLLLVAGSALRSQVPTSLAPVVTLAAENRPAIEQAWREVPEEQRGTMEFLLRNLPERDAKSLAAAFLLREVAQAHAARAQVAWGSTLSDELFRNYVVPFAQANEAREDWRTDFTARFLPKVKDCKTPGEAAKLLNETIFAELNVHYSTGRARADQAPSSSIAQGKASCTGLVDPARRCVPRVLRAGAARVGDLAAQGRQPHVGRSLGWGCVAVRRRRRTGSGGPRPRLVRRRRGEGGGADRQHRLWAVSYAATGERFAAGWGRGIELWGTDESARYRDAGERLERWPWRRGSSQLARGLCFAGSRPPPRSRCSSIASSRPMPRRRRPSSSIATSTPNCAPRPAMRGCARSRLRRGNARELAELQKDHAQNLVRAGGKESPFYTKQVGEKPAGGWPLVIAMHGGGNAPKEVNDSQWRHMQIYYKDHPEAGGYLYCALRAPTDEWNGFYTDYFYPLLEKLIRQFVVCQDVNPDRVVAIGYSHGGYGAFAIGPKLPHRFAAVHASASAPTDGETVATGAAQLPFSFMVGGKDTAYGRRDRCVAFEALLVETKQAHPGLYPTTFTLVEGNGHTGLPDRDILPKLLPNVRVATPKQLFWDPTDGTVKDHYWLRVAEPKRGQHLQARLEGNALVAETKEVAACEAWLDARFCDLAKDLTVEVDGQKRVEKPMPSLRTLCATMRLRGDAQLAASWIVPLR